MYNVFLFSAVAMKKKQRVVSGRGEFPTRLQRIQRRADSRSSERLRLTSRCLAAHAYHHTGGVSSVQRPASGGLGDATVS